MNSQLTSIKSSMFPVWFYLVLGVLFIPPGQGYAGALTQEVPDAENRQSASAQVQLPPEVGKSWWARVQEEIRRSEYKITWQEKTCLEDLARVLSGPQSSP